jgi:hypothetical protein
MLIHKDLKCVYLKIKNWEKTIFIHDEIFAKLERHHCIKLGNQWIVYL